MQAGLPPVATGTKCRRAAPTFARSARSHVQALKVLVLDEADKLLDMDFEKEIDQILSVVPRERRTMLFSATMTSKVQKLQRASLRSPVKARRRRTLLLWVTLRQVTRCVAKRLATTLDNCDT